MSLLLATQSAVYIDDISLLGVSGFVTDTFLIATTLTTLSASNTFTPTNFIMMTSNNSMTTSTAISLIGGLAFDVFMALAQSGILSVSTSLTRSGDASFIVSTNTNFGSSLIAIANFTTSVGATFSDSASLIAISAASLSSTQGLISSSQANIQSTFNLTSITSQVAAASQNFVDILNLGVQLGFISSSTIKINSAVTFSINSGFSVVQNKIFDLASNLAATTQLDLNLKKFLTDSVLMQSMNNFVMAATDNITEAIGLASVLSLTHKGLINGTSSIVIISTTDINSRGSIPVDGFIIYVADNDDLAYAEKPNNSIAFPRFLTSLVVEEFDTEDN